MQQATQVRAKDLMQKDVVQLHTDTPVADAIRTLEEYHISGAPVVDGASNLVGVFSVSDVTRGEHVRSGRVEAEREEYYLARGEEEEEDQEGFDPDGYNPVMLGRETVGGWMKPEVMTVSPETAIEELCQLMVRESIHRVLVVEDKKLVGLISTFDVVRYVAYAG